MITLISYGLVDELRPMSDPLVLGGGKRRFEAVGTSETAVLHRVSADDYGATLTTYSLHASPY